MDDDSLRLEHPLPESVWCAEKEHNIAVYTAAVEVEVEELERYYY